MQPSAAFPEITLTTFIDVLAVAIVVYQLILLIRGRRAAHILTGIGILVMVYIVAAIAGLELLRTILATLAPYTAFALIVMFQSDLRRLLARIGRRSWFSLGSQFERRELVEEVVLAVQQLAEERTGALIVLEGEIGLRTFSESGVRLDSAVSRELLVSIFQKSVTLHDGAVIIRGDRIAAAACFLPLTMSPVSRSYGTRHRAAIGITEESDCVSLVVSEETGSISIASGGELHAATLETVRARVSEIFGFRPQRRRTNAPPPPAAEPEEVEPVNQPDLP